MWMMLQQEEPDDFVLATGETTMVRDFCEMAFAHLGIELTWHGEGTNEKGIVASVDEKQFEDSTSNPLNTSTLTEGQTLIEVDPQYFRPTEVEVLLGDAQKAKETLGWQPEYMIDDLVEDMVEGDFKKLNSTGLVQG